MDAKLVNHQIVDANPSEHAGDLATLTLLGAVTQSSVQYRGLTGQYVERTEAVTSGPVDVVMNRAHGAGQGRAGPGDDEDGRLWYIPLLAATLTTMLVVETVGAWLLMG
jgi:hypothetical protein